MSFIASREQARMVRAAMPAVMAWRDGIKHERSLRLGGGMVAQKKRADPGPCRGPSPCGARP